MNSETVHEETGTRSRWRGWLRRSPLAGGWSALQDLLRWWRGELRELLPARLRLWGTPSLCVEASASELRLFHPPQPAPVATLRVGETGTGGQAPAGDRRCELLLHHDLGLAVPITLPDAAEENLRRVIAFSMDRYTPFREEEVYFDFQITRRDRAQQRIELMLQVVPRATLDRIVQRLAAAGIEVVRADITSHEVSGRQARAGVNLLPLTRRVGSRHQTRLNVALGVSALVLLLAVAIIPLYQRHQAVRALETTLDGMRAQVRAAEQRRADVATRSETLRTIVQRRDAVPPVLDVLRELTILTPDEAWAGQVEMKGGRIRLTGEALAGSELMEALTASNYFADPRFEAPLTQNPKSERERFVISVAVKERANAP